MDSFKHRIFVLNKITGFSTTEFNDIIADIKQMYSCVVLVEHVNRGYQFGFIDSDLMSFNYVRNNIPAYDFYFKYNMDTILYNKFLDITIENTADVIYPPEISCLTPEFKSPELYKTYKDACMDFSTSKEGKFPFEEYAYQETRYQMLTKSDPEGAKLLMKLAIEDVKKKWNFYEQLAKMNYGK